MKGRCDIEMNKTVGLRLAQLLRSVKERDYLEALIAFIAAPTIKGVKPSALMRFAASGKNTMLLWKDYGSVICAKYGLESFELKSGENGVLVLLYKKKLLTHYLSYSKNKPFLECIGYMTDDELEGKLKFLKGRFERLCPHEVGLFLGIPIEDVEGFIANKGSNCLLCRYWKVYGDKKRAQLLFAAYDKARAGMMQLLCGEDNLIPCNKPLVYALQ